MTAARRALLEPTATREVHAGDLTQRDIGATVSFVWGNPNPIDITGPFVQLTAFDKAVRLTIGEDDGWPGEEPYEVSPDTVVLVEEAP